MELDELKNSWNALDKRLAENEIVNLRIVKEMISQKTKTAFDRIYRLHLHNFLISVLLIFVMFPIIFSTTPISDTSFFIVEGMMALGLIPIIRKLILLSKIDLEGKKSNELSSLVYRYKQICHREYLWTIPVVGLTMVGFYVSELFFNKEVNYVFGPKVILVVAFSLLTFALAYVVAIWQRKRHAQQMKEIEQGLEELKEFED